MMNSLCSPLLVIGLLSLVSILSEVEVVKTTVLSYVDISRKQEDVDSTVGVKNAKEDNDASATTSETRPTGLRLALLGDSITRYQYLSLAYFLRHGYFFNPNQSKPHLVNQHTFMRHAPEGQGWKQFLNQTNQLLSPMEYCDCFRAPWPRMSAVDGNVMENRYFHDPFLNNSVAYIQAFGNSVSSMHGRVLPQDAFRNISSKKFTHENSTWKWSHKDWGEALEKYVAPMNVTHVLMNAGLWPNDFHENKPARDSIVRALQKTGLVGIWRTNTYNTTRGLRPSEVNADESMVGLFGDNVLNVSWTRRLQTRLYWDKIHFREPVYRVMNERLLEMVGHEFPPNYQKQSLSELYDPDM